MTIIDYGGRARRAMRTNDFVQLKLASKGHFHWAPTMSPESSSFRPNPPSSTTSSRWCTSSTSRPHRRRPWQVHQTHGIVWAEALQKALDKAVGTAWLGNRPEQQPNQTGPEAEKKREAERKRQTQRKEHRKAKNETQPYRPCSAFCSLLSARASDRRARTPDSPRKPVAAL